jgi:hypothetical protein
MKKLILLTSILILTFALTAQAQSTGDSPTQIDELASRLKRYSSDLANRTYEDIKSDSSNSRREIENAFLAGQFDAGAGLFQQMLGDNRQTSQLLEALEILKDLAGRLPKNSSNESLLQNTENTIKDIERELKNRGSNQSNNTQPQQTVEDRPIIGRALWRGMVDNKVHLLIKGSRIETRTMAGQSYPDGTFTFTAILPEREVIVGINKQEGRGTARVFQQPNPANDFTAIIEIEDPGRGAKEYQFEIFWK